MINRVLIRIKVIQILYSFLLVEKQFTLESCPTAPTKEKRFAYSLYLDMLVLMLRIADSIAKRGGERPLEETRFIKRIMADDTVKSLMARYRMEPFPFEGVVDMLSTSVKDSAIYKNFLKRRGDSSLLLDETIWSNIFNQIIIVNPEVNEIISRRENHTLKGVDRTREMLDTTFRNFMASQDNGADALTALRQSLEKARELYFRMLYLPVELTYMQERALDEKRYKYLVTNQDLNPNMKFVENALVKEIENCEAISGYIEKSKLYWRQSEPVMMDNLLKAILESDIYREYMETPQQGIREDSDFWRNVMKKIVFTNEHFLEAMEDESVFWNDDLEIVGTFVLKTLRRLEEGDGANAVLDKFKDEEDARFGEDLVKAVLKNKDTYKGYIDIAIDRSLWESERMAFMDTVVIETALAEIMNFPKIPLTVSLNEYIEIAKCYSTAKSGGFVNGVLGTIVRRLQEDGTLLKR